MFLFFAGIFSSVKFCFSSSFLYLSLSLSLFFVSLLSLSHSLFSRSLSLFFLDCFQIKNFEFCQFCFDNIWRFGLEMLENIKIVVTNRIIRYLGILSINKIPSLDFRSNPLSEFQCKFHTHPFVFYYLITFSSQIGITCETPLFTSFTYQFHLPTTPPICSFQHFIFVMCAPSCIYNAGFVSTSRYISIMQEFSRIRQ